MTKPGPLCHKCPLLNAPGPIWGEGRSNAKLVVVGQCPGPDEITLGRPFVGGSGGILERSLFRAGSERGNVFVTNAVKCFVQPKTPVPGGAIEACRPLLERELDTLDQKRVILTLGQEAFYGFTRKKMLTVSPPRSIKKPPNPDNWLRGAVYPFNGSIAIVPAAHPAYVASTGFRDGTVFDQDVAKAVRLSKTGWQPIEEHYDYNPSSAQVLEYCNEIVQRGDFALDFETPEKSAAEEEEELLGSGPTEIQVAGISVNPGECIGVPGDMLSLLSPLFTSHRDPTPTFCRVFNWGFEGFHLQRLFGDLAVIPIDLMLQLNRCYSDLKRKDLGTALSLFTDMPYTKNLSKTDPNRYNACDTYGTLIGSRNAQEFMSAMGIFQAYLEADVPLWQAVLDMKTEGTNCDVETAQRMELQCARALSAYEKWWSTNLPLVSWSSPQQLLALFTAAGLPIIYRNRGKHRATDDTMQSGKRQQVKTPSVDQEVLELYAGPRYNNKLAGLLLTMRGLKKASDFTRIYAQDGRAHPTHKIHGQVAGRIQAKGPDLQNIPEEISDIYPRTIIIPDDPKSECIISADFEAIEFYVYGYDSQDREILRCRREGIYIYGMFYESIFNKPFFEPGKPPKKAYRLPGIPPWELLVAKSGPLGFIYGRGPKSFQDGFGIPAKTAYKIYDGLATKHEAVVRHHKVLDGEVNKNGYLRNHFNRIRWFPNPRGMRNEYLSYPGQSNAADILIRNAIIPLHRGIKDFGGRLLFPVHDSVQCSVPRRALGGAVEFIRESLERPIPEMTNFWIPCTIKVGTLENSTTGKPNWGDTTTWEDWLLQYGFNTRTARGVQELPGVQETKPSTPAV